MPLAIRIKMLTASPATTRGGGQELTLELRELGLQLAQMIAGGFILLGFGHFGLNILYLRCITVSQSRQDFFVSRLALSAVVAIFVVVPNDVSHSEERVYLKIFAPRMNVPRFSRAHKISKPCR